MKSVVENDLFGIASQLKSIDESYYVVFDNRLKRFEVHSKEQRGDTLAVVLPFDKLDHRAIWHVYNTRVERIKQLIERIERENDMREKRSMKDKLAKVADEVFG